MRKLQMVTLVGSALLFCLVGCTAKLTPADQALLKQALDSGTAAEQAAKAADASAARAESAASAAEASAGKAAEAASRAEAAANRAELAAQKAEKAFEMGLRK